MVHVPTMEAQREHLDKNLERYKREHPGEWVVISGGAGEDITESFYKTKEAFERAVKPYRGTFGSGILTQRIPLDARRIEYNLAVTLKVNWKMLEDSVGTFKAAELVLKARPYTGRFAVHNNGYLSRGGKEGLETKIGKLDMLEPSNIEALTSQEDKPMHAHLERNGTIISYTLKQIKGIGKK